MKTIVYTIKDELGIHARPAGLLTKLARNFKCTSMFGKPEKMVNASNIIGIMSLGIRQGDEITVTFEGEDEAEAAAAMEEFLSGNL
jgi:phosphocarrier protein